MLCASFEWDTEQVIRECGSITIRNDIFNLFITACDAAEASNQKLCGATF